MKCTVALCLCSFLALGAGNVATSSPADPYAKVLPAIEQVESGGDANAIGDNGLAVGILQIHPVMVDDCNRIAKAKGLNLTFTLADRKDPAKSRQMFRVYSDHYSAGSCEKIARNWNGGPKGHTKNATLPYWAKVRKAMGR